MKKLLFAGLLIALFLAGGCSELQENVDYIDKTKSFISEIEGYTKDITAMIAKEDPALDEELQSTLTEMKNSIDEFQNMEPSEIWETIHQKLEDKSIALEEVVDNAITQVEQGQLNADEWNKMHITDFIYELEELLKNP
jgi:TolA-binding protein